MPLTFGRIGQCSGDLDAGLVEPGSGAEATPGQGCPQVATLGRRRGRRQGAPGPGMVGGGWGAEEHFTAEQSVTGPQSITAVKDMLTSKLLFLEVWVVSHPQPICSYL